MIVESHTKINLGLKVLNQRPDSYHNIETIFIEIDFGDKLTIKKLESGCKITSNADWMPLDNTNLCFKAYEHMSEFAEKDLGVSIYLEKRVPAGSGLGGGSANAAETIKSLNSIYELKMSQNDLEQVASQIGSDVPFFIRGKKQVGEGTGTKLTPIDFPMNKKILLVIPEFLIDTVWAYSQIKNKLKSKNNSTKFADLKRNDFLSFNKFFENDFEKIVIPSYPKIGTLKSKLLELGASFASLSGSGSTVYGIFDDEALALKAKSYFYSSHKTILANPI